MDGDDSIYERLKSEVVASHHDANRLRFWKLIDFISQSLGCTCRSLRVQADIRGVLYEIANQPSKFLGSLTRIELRKNLFRVVHILMGRWVDSFSVVKHPRMETAIVKLDHGFVVNSYSASIFLRKQLPGELAA